MKKIDQNINDMVTFARRVIECIPNPVEKLIFNHNVRDEVNELKANGLLVLRDYFPIPVGLLGEVSQTLKLADPANVTSRFGQPYNLTLVNPQHKIPELKKFMTDRYLLRIARGYLSRINVKMSEQTLEYLPPSEQSQGSYQWHHDLRGKQIKMMVLLTDATRSGQYFRYVATSQKQRFFIRNYASSRFTEEEINMKYGGKIVDCCERAGSVIIFDSNGIHMGKRTPGNSRINFTMNFVPTLF